MALSDRLATLTRQALSTENQAAAAKAKTKADLEVAVKRACEAAEERAAELGTDAHARQAEISEWWDNVRTSWVDHVQQVQKHFEDKRAAHDLKSAQRAAERADFDAAFAVNYALAAIEEAEYAVLEAYLAHREADELHDTTASG